MIEIRGGSRTLSRGERIFKKFSKVLSTLFFRSTELIFRALPEHGFVSFGQIFCAAGKILKKVQKKVSKDFEKSPEKAVGQKWIS